MPSGKAEVRVSVKTEAVVRESDLKYLALVEIWANDRLFDFMVIEPDLYEESA